MKMLSFAAAAVAAAASDQAAGAQSLPGLVEARLLPGWVTPDGTRMTALELRLEPGWKTYWRMPGDSGIPPRFDWPGAIEATYHWPAPEVIDSGGTRTFGYHDALLLPVELSGADTSGPLAVEVTFGLCESICVPAEVTVTAPAPADRPDAAIEAALAAGPRQGVVQPHCTVSEIEDGMRLAASLPHQGPSIPDAAMELDGPTSQADDVWVSAPQVSVEGGRLTATADFVPSSGKPFPLDPAGLRLTLLDGGDAVEISGCRPS